MKKLMIAAAAAAMVSGAFAIGKAQVYDYTATVKTTACKAAKLTTKLMAYFDENRAWPSEWSYANVARGDEIGLRKQVSVKIAGVIWGCDCITISLPAWRQLRGGYLGGYYFWNQQTQRVFNPWRTTFLWNVLNRIDTMTKCEGSYTLVCRQAGMRLFVVGGGFGTVAKTGCDTYVKTISGNLAGVSLIPSDAFGCVLCGGNNCVVATLCDLCYDYVDPFFVDTTALSAVSGTWKIKYNSTATKRISSTPWISRTYTFKKGGNTLTVATAIDRTYAGIYGLNYGADADWEEVLEDMAEYSEEHPVYDLDEVHDAILDNEEYKEVVNLITTWDNDQEAEEEEEDGFVDLISTIIRVIGDAS